LAGKQYWIKTGAVEIEDRLYNVEEIRDLIRTQQVSAVDRVSQSKRDDTWHTAGEVFPSLFHIGASPQAQRIPPVPPIPPIPTSSVSDPSFPQGATVPVAGLVSPATTVIPQPSHGNVEVSRPSLNAPTDSAGEQHLDAPFPYPGTLSSSSLNKTAVLSFVFGMLGASLFYFVGSILAIVFGYAALSQIDKSPVPMRGRNFAKGGLVMGYTVIYTSMLVIIVTLVMLVIRSL